MGEARRVQATVRTLEHKGYGVEDTACILLECDDAIAEVTLTWAAHRRETSFRLIGEDGEIAGDESEVRLFTGGEQTVVHPGGLSGDSSHSDWYAPLFADFLRRIREGAPAAEEVAEAVYVTRVIECAYTSSQAERALALVPTGEAVEEADLFWTPAAVTSTPAPEPERPATEADARRARQAVGRGVALVALVGAVTWMLHDVAWGGVWKVVAAAHPGWIAVAAGVNLVVLVFQAARWLALVRPLAPGATLGSAFRAMITGFTVSAFVPARGGELARVEMFGRETGLPRMVVMGSVLLDTLVNASVLLIGAAVLPFFVRVPLWMRPGGWAALCLFGLGVAAVLALRAGGSPAAAASAEASRLPLRRGLAALATQVRQGLGATADARALALSFSASLGSWVLETNVAAPALRAVGLRLPLGSTLLVLLAVNLALALPVATPANIGTLEIGAILALVELGVPKETAIAFAVSYHLLQLLPIAAIGLFIAMRGWLRARRLAH
jgi:glycosyltransferase AglD